MQTLTYILKFYIMMFIGLAIVDRIIRPFPMQPDQSFLRLFLPKKVLPFLGIFDMARLICSLRYFTMLLTNCAWLGALIVLQGSF